MAAVKYKRVLLKLSGEALAAGADGILNFDFIDRVAEVLVRCRNAGVEIGVIVGAGNIWRGRQGGDMDRTQADHMGMLPRPSMRWPCRTASMPQGWTPL